MAAMAVLAPGLDGRRVSPGYTLGPRRDRPSNRREGRRPTAVPARSTIGQHNVNMSTSKRCCARTPRRTVYSDSMVSSVGRALHALAERNRVPSPSAALREVRNRRWICLDLARY